MSSQIHVSLGLDEDGCLLDCSACSLVEVHRRWKHQVPLKRRKNSTRLHDATTQKIVIFILDAVRNSDPIWRRCLRIYDWQKCLYYCFFQRSTPTRILGITLKICLMQWVGYGLADRGPIPDGAGFFCSPKRPDQFCGPPNLLSSGHRGSSSEIKRPRREGNCPHPSNAEVKNAWRYTSTPPIRVMVKYECQL
jgi:hypothetical protein